MTEPHSMDNGANHGQGSTGRHRPGEEGLPRDGGRRRRGGSGTEEAAPRGAAVVSCAAAGGLHGGDGGVRRGAPLGPSGGWPRPPRAADEPAVRGAVREIEQERRQRRGRDRGGVGASDGALRGPEDGQAGACAAAAPGAADGGAQPHRAVQPDPRPAARVRRRVAEGGGGAAPAAAGGSGDAENELPAEARALFRELGDELRRLDERVAGYDAHLAAVARTTRPAGG